MMMLSKWSPAVITNTLEGLTMEFSTIKFGLEIAAVFIGALCITFLAYIMLFSKKSTGPL